MTIESSNDDGSLSNFRTEPVSFVRRSARLSTGRQRAWDNYRDDFVVEVPRHIADTSVDPEYVFDAEAAFGRSAPLVVEIGSGLGEAVIAAAETNPERDYLAIEVYTPGIAQTLMQIGRRSLSNVRLMQVNAPEALETTLPAASVSELWVFFPDPWHKSRHHKRRLISSGFADLAARTLEPGGLWRLATDWADYAEVMRQVVNGSEHFTNLHPAELVATNGTAGAGQGHVGAHRSAAGGWAPRFEGRILTNFEKKAGLVGRDIYDLTYQRA